MKSFKEVFNKEKRIQKGTKRVQERLYNVQTTFSKQFEGSKKVVGYIKKQQTRTRKGLEEFKTDD